MGGEDTTNVRKNAPEEHLVGRKNEYIILKRSIGTYDETTITNHSYGMNPILLFQSTYEMLLWSKNAKLE